MKFIAILNRETEFGKSMNALAHMSLGLGPWLQGIPDISIFFGNSNQVREFRELAATLNKEQESQTIFSDFINTMSGGNTDEQLAITANTSTAELTYYASCFTGETLDSKLATLTESCSQLTDYVSHSSHHKANLKNPHQSETPSILDRKISMLINSKLPVAQTINAVVIASLAVGNKVGYSKLRLLNFADKDGVHHANISHHPFVILKPENPAKHSSMAENARLGAGLVSETIRNANHQPMVTVVFGSRREIEEVILRKQTRLFNDVLEEKDLT